MAFIFFTLAKLFTENFLIQIKKRHTKKVQKKHSQTRRKTAPQKPPRKLKNAANTTIAIGMKLFDDCRRPGSFGESEGQCSKVISDSFFEFEKNEIQKMQKSADAKSGHNFRCDGRGISSEGAF